MRNPFKLDLREDLDRAIREQEPTILKIIRPAALMSSKLLEDGETVTHVTGCKVDGTPAVLILTDQRVLAVSASLTKGGSQTVPISKVTQVDVGYKGLGMSIDIKGSGVKIEAEKVFKNGQALVSALRSQID